MPEKVTVIGAGFAGLSTASVLAQNGYQVTVIDRLSGPGGRCRQRHAGGFIFDTGPSWYWMPDVIDRFFSRFGKKTPDYFDLVRLSPSYKFFWEEGTTEVPSSYTELKELFESYETGAAAKLDIFLKEAEAKYRWGIDKLVYLPCKSPAELLIPGMLKDMTRMNVLGSVSAHIRKYFKDPRIQSILEFPVLFLGAGPDKIPALYSLMCHADIKLGTWYPMGGMYCLPRAMADLAEELGVNFNFNENVSGFRFKNNRITHVISDNGEIASNHVVSAADYHFTEQHLLPENLRTYSESYWDKRKLSPSCLLFYIGVNKKIEGLHHHNLFFDQPKDKHLRSIYKDIELPEDPLFYVCCPTKTDSSVAPEGCENLFVLIPLAAGTDVNGNEKETYFKKVISRIEKAVGTEFIDSIIVKESYSGRDFVADYNAFKGNAYGLANTLFQTAHFRPSMRSKKVKNLLYAGQLTIPGPGIPPSIISGQIAAEEISNPTHGYF